MDVGIRAARAQRAQDRIVSAACVLADRFGLDSALAEATRRPQGRDVAVIAMKQQEAAAELLDALVAMTMPTTPALPDEDTEDASTD